MIIHNIETLNEAELQAMCIRSNYESASVSHIIDEVKAGGDSAVRKLTFKHDRVLLQDFKVTDEAIIAATNRIPDNVKSAYEQAAMNIRSFHELKKTSNTVLETMPGVNCHTETRPIERVGLYVPGGSAPLPSTALMLGIPAAIAGCEEVCVVTPPEKNTIYSDIILYAAQLCGIRDIYTVGGPMAIAALAYGTESIPKVDKIFGPGNKYVTAAKMQVSTDPEGAAIDIPAGPTEVLVIADESARADFVASDLLAQAEHGPTSQSILVCTNEDKTKEILEEVERQRISLSRKDDINGALDNSYALVVNSTLEAISFANRYAPEHLILNTLDADTLAMKVNNAGSVFIGEYSCESAGDYASGPNHCLPTLGYARVVGGVSLRSFQKQITFQKVTAEGAKILAPIVSIMAEQEGLDGHRRAMEIRVEN